jgi:protocatechuate 3,4-dioxygenase beta subunit
MDRDPHALALSIALVLSGLCVGCGSQAGTSKAAAGGIAGAQGAATGGSGAFVPPPIESDPLKGLVHGCAITPEQTEEANYVSDAPRRYDIRDDRQGATLYVRIWLNDVDKNCQGLPGIDTEIWHADAQGTYSGVKDATGDADTRGEFFLRGIQQTDDKGFVEFKTIYPGWVAGRAPHINFKVHLGGDRTLDSQMYFPQAITEAIFRQPQYRMLDVGYISNDEDPVLNEVPDAYRRVVRAGVFVYADGFMSELVVGIHG